MRHLGGRVVWAFVLLAGLVAVFFLLPNSLFYRLRRPTRIGRWTNRAMAALYGTRATPQIMSMLEVRRRRTGGVQRVPVVIAKHNGGEYLVSMLGEGSEWVKNVYADGGAAVLRHGLARNVRLELVPEPRRAPILKAYVQRAIGARPHIAVAPDAPLSEFEHVAGEYPVFRVGPPAAAGLSHDERTCAGAPS